MPMTYLQSPRKWMCISTVTLAELYDGVEQSANLARNLAEVEGFAARLEVLDFDGHAAAHTGQIRADQGRANVSWHANRPL